MTTAELAQQIILWIRHTYKETKDYSLDARLSTYTSFVDNVETLCKEQLASPTLPVAQLPSSIPGLTEGRCVHYTAYNGRCLAALVIGHTGSTADLAVFTNLANVNGVKNFGTQFHQEIAYSEESKPGTWHWIERA